MSGLLGRLWATLLRIMLLLAGLAMFFGVLVFGAIAAVGITAWALIRGRRVVPLDFGWKGPVDWRSGARRQPGQQAPADAEVVDIEAKVIDKPSAPPADVTPQDDRTGR